MPDLNCPNPNCGREIHLDKATYSWYSGSVICQYCHSTIRVEIGDWEITDTPLGRTRIPQTERFTNRPDAGGIPLSEPTLVRGPVIVPPDISRIGATVPERINDSFQDAVRHCDNEDFQEAVVRCRYSLEYALMEKGINRTSLRAMASEAQNNGLITERAVTLCLTVASYGGDAAHPQTNPSRNTSREDAVMVIDVTAGVLRHLYP